MKHWAGALVVVLLGCGGGGDDQAAVDATPVTIDADVGPCTSQGGDGGTHKLFLNFESQALTPGPADATQNITPLINEAGTSPPWFDGNANREASIAMIVANVTSILAPFDIEVTETRPSAGPYTMMAMGGVPSDLGLTGSFGSLAATAGCNPIENVVHLIFDQSLELATATVVAAFGIGSGIPTVEQNGSCMCWNDPLCDPRVGVCTIGGDADVDTETGACQTGGETTNVHDDFKQAFGCRP